jgi:hypothetical protein
MKTESIKAISVAFTNACRVVAEAVKNGVIERAKGSVGADNVKVTSTIRAGHSLTDNALKDLKKAMGIHNAGHAFQNAFGVSLASLGTYADERLAVEAIESQTPATSAERPTVEAEAAPAEAPAPATRRNGRQAPVAAQ